MWATHQNRFPITDEAFVGGRDEDVQLLVPPVDEQVPEVLGLVVGLDDPVVDAAEADGQEVVLGLKLGPERDAIQDPLEVDQLESVDDAEQVLHGQARPGIET